MRRLFNFGLLVTYAAIIFAVWTFFSTEAPMTEAQTQTLSRAQAEGAVEKIDKFYWLNKEKSTYTILGKNKKGKEMVYTYLPDEKKDEVIEADQLITERDALAIAQHDLPGIKVQKATLGYFNQAFIWEVSFIDKNGKLGYHDINAETGIWTETIDNL